ncbi:MAG TPA: MFS transporter [Spirochaetia bacterium]|nr:MFS transporter [Spirochaetia bacterium]
MKPDQQPSAAPTPHASGVPGLSKGVVLFVTAMASFLTPFMGSSINIALPTIGREFHAGAFGLSWISTVYLLAAAMFLVPVGRLADIHGRKRVFLTGMTGYTVVSLLCGLSTSEAMLITLRALQGTADALMFATATAIVTSVYPPQERGRALGVNVASVYAGLALGPFIGGVITHYLGWRGIFYFTTGLGLLTIALTAWKMKDEWAEAAGQKMDWPGAALYSLTLLAIMNGFRLLPELWGIVLMGAGVLSLVGFVLRENRSSHPVLDMGLFRNNVVFALSNLSALINYAATFALTFLLSLYLQYTKGLDPRAAGLVMLSQPVIMSVFSPIAGRLADRIEPRVVASVGMAMSTAGLLLTSLLDLGSSLAHIVMVLMLCGLGFALFSSPNTSAIMGSVERKHYGVASATTSAMRLIGQMLSMATAGMIIALYVGKVQITAENETMFLNGFRTAFLIFAGLCLAGIFASLARGRLHGQAAAQRQ